jgi:hypothetical protein
MSNPSNPAISHLYPGRATGLVTRVRPGTRNFVPKFPRPAERRRSRNAWRQGIVAALALIVCLTLGVAGTDAFLTHRDAMAAIATASNKQLYIGSIVFYPELGNRCHQLFFDNRDGKYADNGSVDCTRATTELSKDVPKDLPGGRTDIISKGFR